MMKSINSIFFKNFTYAKIIKFLLIILPVFASGGIQDVLKLQGSFPDIGKINEFIQKGDNFKKTAPLDSPSDEDAQHNYNPPGMPTMPIACGNMKNSNCGSCYKNAYEKVNDLRRYFEQLRALYVETDEFTKASVAFGDSIAGSVGVGGLQWIHDREKIQNSFKQFKKAYKKKYNELLGRLEQVLKEIAQCEEQYFGNKDWYSRYGFMFLNFMALHYAR
ncbi:hypothetical protein YH65_04565 [Sulfurovum lithotrophicum]|uniref:Uncharacterized protein n=1 Tax=Sulfurovum lithotrophicum TaxID=206403 RepID=A0A7U4M0S4_9BACT|nr:hypothetical protein [Sulfurovum lithotrophicum]AKF24739.1 hypothetical protein YH65_04565 [Sulfurovum lithotrophicum]